MPTWMIINCTWLPWHSNSFAFETGSGKLEDAEAKSWEYKCTLIQFFIFFPAPATHTFKALCVSLPHVWIPSANKLTLL